MRRASFERQTGETNISVKLNLDNYGDSKISTSIPFMDHMLSQVAMHGKFNIKLEAKGDIDIDFHHTVEDMGISLGEAFKKAIGGKKGIRRYGEATVPLNEALASVVLDISGRPFLIYNVNVKKEKIGKFDIELVEEFFRAFANHSGITIHINLLYGNNLHHIIEAVFKAFARALNEAAALDKNIKSIPSTKGNL